MNLAKSVRFVSWLLLLLALTSALMASIATFTGKVVSVTDGDTIGIMRDGKSVKVRLDGIDCPESGQDFGTKAKQFTSSMVFGKEVTADTKDVDKYGRLVCRIIVDGRISLELVKAGMAWHYKQYSDDQARRCGSCGERSEGWTLEHSQPNGPVGLQARQDVGQHKSASQHCQFGKGGSEQQYRSRDSLHHELGHEVPRFWVSLLGAQPDTDKPC